MMDVLERLLRVARAHLNAGRDTSWQDRETTWEDPHSGDAGFGSDHTEFSGAASPYRDPRLVGYYANLEVPYGADLETVRRGWRRLLKKYHPDLHGDDPEKRRIANELTAELTLAYRELEKTLGKEGSAH